MRNVIATVFAIVSLGSVALAQDGGLAARLAAIAEEAANHGRPLKKVPFPAIIDWSSLKIGLQRTRCLGMCPSYKIEIESDGTVRYDGDDFVAVTGHHVAHIKQSAVRALYTAFAKADFFWTPDDDLTLNAEDTPDTVLTISFDGRSKSVIHRADTPKEIAALENDVDDTANSDLWVTGNADTFSSLEAEGWDFHGSDPEHLALIESSAKSGNTKLVRQLIAAGLNARTVHGCKGLETAIRLANADIVDALVTAGAPVHWDAPKGEEYRSCDALIVAAWMGIPGIVQTILKGHPNVNWQNDTGETALMQAVEGISNKMHPESDFPSVVNMLIGAGADVNIRDRRGNSAIMYVTERAAVVRALVAAGAKDINARDYGGDRPLMQMYDGEVTQAMLESGADPWIVNDEGKNALEVVSERQGPNNPAAIVLKRWMETHPKPKG